MTAQFPYIKLPGARRGLVRKATLWEGPDHLFSVSGTRFSEKYRRFDYRDIQALVMQKRAHPGSVGIWLLGAFGCAFFAAIALSASLPGVGSPAYRLGLWLPSAFLALYLIYRLIVSLGYSCRCYIQTAVTREELPSLYRVWNARKALARIRAKVAEAQGSLPENPQTPATEDLGLASFALVQGSRPETQEAVAAQDATEGQQRVASMKLALLGCVAVMLLAAFLFWYMDAAPRYANNPAILAPNALLTLLAGSVFLWSLLRLYKPRLFRSLRNFLLAALGLLGIHAYFSFLLLAFYLQNDFLSVALRSPAVQHWCSLIDGVVQLGLGLFGVALLVFNWQTYKERPIFNR